MLTKLNTSLRIRNVEDTIKIAELYREKLGITRVVNITPLDRIGIPVYSSVRPDSHSLCVNAGKGLTNSEAYAGAIMEAIEYAFAELRYNKADFFFDTLLNILKKSSLFKITDFQLLIDKKLDIDENIPWIQCNEILTGTNVPVPAELVLNPLPDKLGRKIFGANTNGLASGNSVLEATIHGILEVIEHDIRSFQLINDTSTFIPINSLDKSDIALVKRIKRKGFDLWIRNVANDFQFPFFYCYITEKGNENPYYINSGYGCHFYKDIALMRAITEAIQSRLTFIQGSRDDLEFYYNFFSNMSHIEKNTFSHALLSKASSKKNKIRYPDIKDHAPEDSESLKAYFNLLIYQLKKSGFDRVFRYVYTRPSDKLQIVRILIPEMENFSNASPRVGKRLLQAFKVNKYSK